MHKGGYAITLPRRKRRQTGEERREKPLYGQQPLNEVLRSDDDGSVDAGIEGAFGQGLGRLFQASDLLIPERLKEESGRV